ncbi:putative tetratricopeptide repeat protein 27 [Trichinella spiralis]|nr:putative tetratricopeptide repeat protein 27 [Trichinella spiralis]
MHNRRLIIILIAILIGYTHGNIDVVFTLLKLWIICHSFICKDRAKLQLFTALLLKASYGEPLVSFCLPYETALPIGDFCLILNAFIRHEKHPSPEQQF